MSAVPVYWKSDPYRLEPAIHCACCRLCHWANPTRNDLCIYGGPFAGFVDRHNMIREGKMTDDQQQEYALLKLANDHGVFAIELVATLGIEQQWALERLLRRRWVTLIDVAQIKTAPGLFRLFLASPEALTWYRASG